MFSLSSLSKLIPNRHTVINHRTVNFAFLSLWLQNIWPRITQATQMVFTLFCFVLFHVISNHHAIFKYQMGFICKYSIIIITIFSLLNFLNGLFIFQVMRYQKNYLIQFAYVYMDLSMHCVYRQFSNIFIYRWDPEYKHFFINLKE